MTAKKRTPRKKATVKAPKHANVGGADDSVQEVDVDTPIVPRVRDIGEPIDVNKVYTIAQFAAALGLIDVRTIKNYFDRGLDVRHVPGTQTEFIRGKDWYEFLGEDQYLSSKYPKLTGAEVVKVVEFEGPPIPESAWR